jgi:hypothetical protein
MLWVRISIRARCTTLCDKVCQWITTGRWFSSGALVSSTNKTDRHNITEILLKVALYTIKQTNNLWKCGIQRIYLFKHILRICESNLGMEGFRIPINLRHVSMRYSIPGYEEQEHDNKEHNCFNQIYVFYREVYNIMW